MRSFYSHISLFGCSVNSILLTSAHCAGIFIESGIFLGGTTVDGSGSTYYDVEAELPNPNYGMSHLRFLISTDWLVVYIYIRNFIELNFNLYCFSTYTVDVDTDANGTRKLDKILF